LIIKPPKAGDEYVNLKIENFKGSSKVIISFNIETTIKASATFLGSKSMSPVKFVEWEWLGHHPNTLKLQPMMKLPNSNKFDIYLGRVVIFDYPWMLGGQCMYTWQIVKSETTGYTLSTLKEIFDLNECDGTLVFKGRADSQVLDLYKFDIEVALNKNLNSLRTITLEFSVKKD